MTPLRILIIGILVYILYRLLTGPRRKVDSSRKDRDSDAIQDVLIEDPVCHTYVPKGQAVQLHHNKKMYYFCSNKCCEMFLKDKGAEE